MVLQFPEFIKVHSNTGKKRRRNAIVCRMDRQVKDVLSFLVARLLQCTCKKGACLPQVYHLVQALYLSATLNGSCNNSFHLSILVCWLFEGSEIVPWEMSLSLWNLKE